ncbi:MAG: Clp protease N-terminal domain-containing protein [Candidatus Coprovivens sp.]
MEELFDLAEKEMIELKHPYVGTEHFMLAYLKKYGNKYLDYNEFKSYILKVIGSSHKGSEYILYTPILRTIKNDCHNIYEAMIKILTNDDSIAYNLLLSMKVDIEAIYLNIINTDY